MPQDPSADQSGMRFAHRLQGRPSLTAEAVTLARAIEHVRPVDKRVVDDPWAYRFLSTAGRAALAAYTGTITGRLLRRLDLIGTTWVPLRHRFIDDHLVAALAAGVEQVVLLGAGYDTRAYRLAERLDRRPVFEVDLAAISRRKASIIADHAAEFPESNVVRVEIDFETQRLEDRLAEAGFRDGAPTFFTWEGVPMYLTRDAVKATLDAVWAVSGTGSTIAHDMWHLVDDPSAIGTAQRIAPGALTPIGEAITFAVHPEDMRDFYGHRGFEIRELVMAPDLPERYDADRATLLDGSMYVLVADRVG